MNKLSTDAKKSMNDRIVTALILVLVCAPCLFIGGWFFAILVFAATFFACHEFINATKNKSYSLFLHVFVHVVTYSFIFWTLIKNNLIDFGWEIEHWSFVNAFNANKSINVSVIGIAVGFLVLFFLTLNHEKFNVSDATYLCTMMVFMGLAIQSFLYLRFRPACGVEPGFFDVENSTLLVYVILGTFLSDAGAYFFGILFGKNKMNERISPKKTWEGFVGGVITSTVLSFLFAFLLAYYKHPILKDIFDYEHWYNILIVSLIMPLTANLGDFIFSSIKRNYQVKDFGTLLKGHGGVLDRIDSLLVTSLVVTIIIIFMGHRLSFLL